MMRIGVLAVQGAFIEHEHMLRSLGVSCFEIRNREDSAAPFDGLILPGGESTVMGALLRDLELLEPLRERIRQGLPVLGTCAGLILLAEELPGGEAPHLATLPAAVSRNVYGRQLGSFTAMGEVADVGAYPLVFIRAPGIIRVGEGAQVFASLDGRPVGVRYQNQIGVAFHPELSGNPAVHQAFLAMAKR